MATTFPDQIQTFKTYQDITSTDADLVIQYQNAMERGDIEYANSILTSITNYANKILTATDLNTIYDTCAALQEYYLDAYSPAYVVSETQPASAQTGDLWFKITGEEE